MKKRTKRIGRFARFFKRKRSAKGENPLNIVLPAAIYGAGRQYLSNLATPITSKLPLGTYADEVLFGVVGYFAAKKGKGMVKQLGKAALTIEAASMGNQLIGKVGIPTNNNSSSW